MAAPIAAAIFAAGGTLKAFGQISEGIQARNLAKQNAQIALREGEIALQSGRENARQTRQRALQVAGSQRARAAASGIRAEGSVIDTLNITARELELDALKAEFLGELGKAQKTREAQLQRFAGQQAFQAGIIGGVSSLLGAGAQAAGSLSGSITASRPTGVSFFPSTPGQGGGVFRQGAVR